MTDDSTFMRKQILELEERYCSLMLERDMTAGEILAVNILVSAQQSEIAQMRRLIKRLVPYVQAYIPESLAEIESFYDDKAG